MDTIILTRRIVLCVFFARICKKAWMSYLSDIKQARFWVHSALLLLLLPETTVVQRDRKCLAISGRNLPFLLTWHLQLRRLGSTQQKPEIKCSKLLLQKLYIWKLHLPKYAKDKIIFFCIITGPIQIE